MKTELILASTSPRRRHLLELAGFHFDLHAPHIDETPGFKEDPLAFVKRMAREKCQEVASRMLPKKNVRFLVIAADTIVVLRRQKKVHLLNKPTSLQEAESMLKLLSGKTHEVYTSYRVLEMKRGKASKSLQKTCRTKVAFAELGREVRESYLKTGEGLDKAGAYAAQGIGMSLIQGIHGSYTNVMGLPLVEVVETLRENFKFKPESM